MRTLARRWGLGRALLKAQTFASVGLAAQLKVAAVRRTLLPDILQAPPIAGRDANCEVHMLLHAGKFLEGMWGLYSCLHHAGDALRPVLHSDGSLDADHFALVRRLFPNVRIVERAAADQRVRDKTQGRTFIRRHRESSIFSLKLVDPLLFAETDRYIMCDSDVLVFRDPQALYSVVDGNHRYSQDNNDVAYSALPDDLEKAAGHPVVRRLNAGVLSISRSRLSIDEIEAALEAQFKLITSPQSLYFFEQTAYAIALGRNGAFGLPVDEYSICGNPSDVVTGHYCGGGYWGTLYYRGGVPALHESLGLGSGRARVLA